MIPFGATDVLDRAVALVTDGEWTGDCGDWCPWCAISDAKTDLDSRHNIWPPLTEILAVAFTGRVSEYDVDAPLVGARTALKPFADIEPAAIDQALCLEMLQFAKDSLGGRVDA